MKTAIEKISEAQRLAPVDVIRLAEDLGVRVNETFLDGEISGELVRNSNGGFEINVNASHAPTRQRFTVAHELGHFLQHRDLIGDGLDDDRAYRSTQSGRYFNTRIGPRQETQANQFAASLLMPSHLIERLRNEGLDRREMAARLGVSEHAMAIRLGEPYP
ncbi:MAG: ImmA/IrrE family metallo-endopeptidase [Pseudomonadota bacterium]